MGSQSFEVRSTGRNAQEAYNNAVEDANRYYGHQEGYSGAINATPGFTDVTSKYKASSKDLHTYIQERLEVLSKHNDAECICIRVPKENTNKVKTQVEHIVTPGTKKWVLKYTVCEHWSDIQIASCDKKGEAVVKARAHTEKTGRPTYVKMEKVLDKASSTVAKITYKKSTTERDGEYIFYGWASC